ncbi:hypothetical protein L1987_15853 [Smallanthus sonchifolius]|uniref:Uncharacterized protein n=1 Tax=Smallanthus sonchifolius TaxID=185202 RepID=A0ACB9J889_9ASTR|nr:hypothetical protein L1987_15853 [Smallanthus sonchifolius]
MRPKQTLQDQPTASKGLIFTFDQNLRFFCSSLVRFCCCCLVFGSSLAADGGAYNVLAESYITIYTVEVQFFFEDFMFVC